MRSFHRIKVPGTLIEDEVKRDLKGGRDGKCPFVPGRFCRSKFSEYEVKHSKVVDCEYGNMNLDEVYILKVREEKDKNIYIPLASVGARWKRIGAGGLDVQRQPSNASSTGRRSVTVW
jgi:hypothetical protein